MSDWRKDAEPADWRSEAQPVEEARPEPTFHEKVRSFLDRNPGAPDETGQSIRAMLGRASYGLAPKLVEASGEAPPGEAVKQYQQAEQRFPVHAAVGAMLAPAPFGGLAKGAAGAALNIAGNAGLTTLGEHNLNPEASPSDLAQTALFSGGLTGLGELAGMAAGKLTNYAQKLRADRAAKDAAEVQKEVGAAWKKVGGETQKGSRMGENILRELSAGQLDPSTLRHAGEVSTSPEGLALREQVLANNMGDYRDQLSSIQHAQADAMVRQANASSEAARRTAEYFAPNTLTKDVAPRVSRYAGRALGGAIGSALGYEGGKEAGHPFLGAELGGIAGIAMGKPGTALGNLVRNPRFQVQTAEKLAPAFSQAQRAAQGAGRAAPTFSNWLEGKRDEAKDRLEGE